MKNKKQSSLIVILCIVCFLIILVISFLVFLSKPGYTEKGRPGEIISGQNDDETQDREDGETSDDSPGRTYPLYFSVMVHMEEDWNDDTDAALFQRHVDMLNLGMDLFDSYNAQMTIESAEPFANAILASENTILDDALDRGHGVGTHCGSVRAPKLHILTEEYRAVKALVDEIVGADDNRGCSGGWGTADYIIGATDAGFGYLDGVVYLAWLAIPQAERPGQLSDEEIRSVYYHDPVFTDISDRIYPRFVTDAKDFKEDDDGQLVFLVGETGEISSLYEDRKTCSPSCVLTEDDFEVIYDLIEQANAIHDTSRVAHLYIHIPANTFKEENRELLETWLAEMQGLQDAGKIQWATMGEVYDAKLSERE